VKRSKTILNYFPRYIFWDTKPENLDIEYHAQYIIERVMKSCADIDDFNNAVSKLEMLYNKKLIKESIINSREYIPSMKFFAKIRYLHTQALTHA
jgi:hypothetical protein